MSQIDIPVGERFVATVINSEGKEDCIAVQCVPADSNRKCSMCAFNLTGCTQYNCMASLRKDVQSVYFREVAPRTLPLEKEDKYECVRDEDVSEEPATAENKESGNDCAENEESVMLEDISLDKVKAIHKVAEELLELTNFRYCFGHTFKIKSVKFYDLSGESQTILPSVLKEPFSEFVGKQLPIAIDKSVKELKNLVNNNAI